MSGSSINFIEGKEKSVNNAVDVLERLTDLRDGSINAIKECITDGGVLIRFPAATEKWNSKMIRKIGDALRDEGLDTAAYYWEAK